MFGSKQKDTAFDVITNNKTNLDKIATGNFTVKRMAEIKKKQRQDQQKQEEERRKQAEDLSKKKLEEKEYKERIVNFSKHFNVNVDN